MSLPAPVPDRAPGRLRPWRLVSFAASLGLTLSAVVLAVTGVGGPSAPLAAPVAAAGPAAGTADDPPGGAGAVLVDAVGRLRDGLDHALRRAPAASGERPPPTADASDPRGLDLPPRSGTGRRAIFDQSAQRVWLVRDNDTVLATYPVSGSVQDNLQPGRYSVYSRSRHAVGFDYRSTMDHMVRFTQGHSSAIGFHDIPDDLRGRPLQRVADLGTATSSGCIRQRHRDAVAMWRFAQLGATVVVVA